METILTVEKSESGKRVIAWAVSLNGEQLAGGYAANVADARNDAAIWIRSASL